MKRAIQAAFLFFLFFFSCDVCAAREELANSRASAILEQPKQPFISKKLSSIKKELSNKISKFVLKFWDKSKKFIIKEIKTKAQKSTNSA